MLFAILLLAADDARFVGEQIAREAFHNVSYFAGTLRELQEAK